MRSDLACAWSAMLLAASLGGCGVPSERADAGADATSTPDATPDAGWDAGPQLPDPPATLSQAGLFVSGVAGPTVAGALPYDVRYPLWTDGADKERYLVLPDGGSIDTTDPDQWAFPEGTRVFKTFLVEGTPVETRLLWKAGPSVTDWVYVSYRYRPDGSDADPVPDGEEDALGTAHDVPSTEGCRDCHRGGGDFVLGIGAIQLAQEAYDDWIDRGILPPDAPRDDPPGTAVQAAALGYLHGNCGHCHGPVHPLANVRPMRLRLPVGVDDPLAAPAWATTADVEGHHTLIDSPLLLMRPGDPAGSQLFNRMNRRDGLSMPPRGTELVDPDGAAAVRAWILSGAP